MAPLRCTGYYMDIGRAKTTSAHDVPSQPSLVLCGKRENKAPMAPPTGIMHPHIEKALSLIEEAVVLEEAMSTHKFKPRPKNYASSLGELHQQAATKYNKAVSYMKSYVEQIDRQKSRASTNAKKSVICLLVKIKKYKVRAYKLNDLAKGLAFPFSKEVYVSEEVASAHWSEPQPCPATGDEENHASSRGALHQESAAKCHVKYVKQLDRQQSNNLKNSVKRKGQDKDKEEQHNDDKFLIELGLISREPPQLTSVHIVGAPEEKQWLGSRNLAKKEPAKKKALAKKKMDTKKKAPEKKTQVHN
jgi:hypothetical protein